MQDPGETPAVGSSSLPADPSLHSLTDGLSDVMENSVLSLHPNNSSHDADSEGEEPREEIMLPPPAPAAPAGRTRTERREDSSNCSLHQLARKLCWRFLLSEEKGEMVSDVEVRVSVKTLSLTCLAELVSLSPQVWNLPLLPTSTDRFTDVLISDLVLYLDHQDPGLRGATARLVFRLLRGASLESGGRLGRWFQTSDRD